MAKPQTILVPVDFSECSRPALDCAASIATPLGAEIVMGTHGHTGFSHAMLGSVAERVVRRAPCPVLTLRGLGPTRALKIRRILVPVDYSDTSGSALDYAHRLGQTFGAELDIVHVWDRPAFVSADVVMVHERDGSRKSLGDLIREGAENEMRTFLDARRGDAQGTAQRPAYRLLAGEPASTLIAELEKGTHDLVVLGTQGRTGLRHLLLGSVAEKLVQLAPVPVLTVPPPGRGAR